MRHFRHVHCVQPQRHYHHRRRSASLARGQGLSSHKAWAVTLVPLIICRRARARGVSSCQFWLISCCYNLGGIGEHTPESKRTSCSAAVVIKEHIYLVNSRLWKPSTLKILDITMVTLLLILGLLMIYMKCGRVFWRVQKLFCGVDGLKTPSVTRSKRNSLAEDSDSDSEEIVKKSKPKKKILMT